MPDIFHQFPINESSARVFAGVTTPEGLDTWWTKRSAGQPAQGAEYELLFGPAHDWRAVVTRCVPNREFALEFTTASEDWPGTRVGFLLDEKNGVTQVRFHHRGWPQETENYRGSCYCWAMYLRLLKRYVEHGEVVPYGRRLDV